MSEGAAVRAKANTKVEQNRVPDFTIVSYSLQILPRKPARAGLIHNFLFGLAANVSIP
jgi:hypothetical protein